ncbi:hypothetical protein SASPL_121888 [Salvia splendens]|uniref:DUF1677 domain-containing protein n=1 Tax=Salvia splendens TaxID=180675 RepID=A0A8X8XID3_SALSN|nr:hypothetical protein SASPL_121888 [Salvia splendens]
MQFPLSINSGTYVHIIQVFTFIHHQKSSMENSSKPKQAAATTVLKATDLAFAKCECCGLTEECTGEYIKRVRDRFSGRWICGLCSEAVKDEVNVSPPKSPTDDELISAVKQLLFKSLDSPRSSPVKKRCLILER